jgi:hypothetical protein
VSIPPARPASSCPTGCGRTVKPGHLMCGPCWREVPKHLQVDVWRTWRAYDKEPSDQRFMEYSAAREAAVAAIP